MNSHVASYGNPALGKFNPLPRIIAYDDFDHGVCGWTQLVGNYEETLDNIKNSYDTRAPMLSSVPMFDIGSHGAMDGTYSLKIATRGQPGHFAYAVKRMTWQRLGMIQLEAFITYTVEASRLTLGDEDFRAFTIQMDLQDGFEERGRRAIPSIRYHNSQNGELRRVWQTRSKYMRPKVRTGTSDKASAGSTHSLRSDEFEDIPDAYQPLCYNEVATKINWHYVRWLVDLDRLHSLEFQCNDRVYDLRGNLPVTGEAESNLSNLLNLAFAVEADADRRCLFYVDSVLLSGEE